MGDTILRRALVTLGLAASLSLFAVVIVAAVTILTTDDSSSGGGSATAGNVAQQSSHWSITCFQDLHVLKLST